MLALGPVPLLPVFFGWLWWGRGGGGGGGVPGYCRFLGGGGGGGGGKVNRAQYDSHVH